MKNNITVQQRISNSCEDLPQRIYASYRKNGTNMTTSPYRRFSEMFSRIARRANSDDSGAVLILTVMIVLFMTVAILALGIWGLSAVQSSSFHKNDLLANVHAENSRDRGLYYVNSQCSSDDNEDIEVYWAFFRNSEDFPRSVSYDVVDNEGNLIDGFNIDCPSESDVSNGNRQGYRVVVYIVAKGSEGNIEKQTVSSYVMSNDESSGQPRVSEFFPINHWERTENF